MLELQAWSHVLISYTLWGGLLAFLCAWAFSCTCGGSRKLVRLMLYFTLGVPLLGLLARQFLPGYQWFLPFLRIPGFLGDRVTFFFCLAGYWGSLLLTPLLGLALFYTFFQSFRSYRVQRRLTGRLGYATPQQEPLLFTLLDYLSRRAGVIMPRIVILPITQPLACVGGFFRPFLMISQGLVKELAEEELQAVLAHELAHIKRRDLLLNWLTVALRNLSFYSPMAHKTFSMLRWERELAGDALAVQLTGKPLVYGQTLIRVWRNSLPVQDAPAGAGYLALVSTKQWGLAARVNLVVNGGNGQEKLLRWLALPAVLLVLAGLPLVC